jgi:Tfp pilus assembly protein PilO
VTRRVPLIAGVLVVVILLGWYVAIWRPDAAHLSAARASEVTATAKRAQLDSELAGLLGIERKLPALEAQLQAGVTAVPATASLDTVIDQINAIAIADQIEWTTESQGAASAGSSTSSSTGNSTLTLTLAVAGSYSNMTAFITDLEHRPRLIVLDSLAFAPGSGGRVSVSISGRAFYDSSPLPKLPKT